MAIVGDTTILDRPGILSSLKEIAGIQEVDSFLIFLALLIVFVLFISSILSMYTIWRLSMYAAEVGAELSSRLYNFYIYKPWLFHAQSNSTQLTNKIAQECERVLWDNNSIDANECKNCSCHIYVGCYFYL